MTHGGNIYEISRQQGITASSILDFSANINPLGIPISLKNTIMEVFDEVVNYPDIHYTDLKKAIGAKYQLAVEDIYLGNGGAQVIFDFIRAVNPKKSLVVYPTFAEYERALKAVDSEIIDFYLKEEEDFTLKVEELMKVIDESIDLVILCNPNNPTGALIEGGDLRKLLDQCHEKGVFLMVDEAFMDFADEGDLKTLLKEVKTYPNLLITRSFTKFYGIPGLRLGFGASSHPLIKEVLVKLTIPWNVNTFASYFGRVLLEDDRYEKETYQWLKKETAWFTKELRELGLFKVYRPSANYIFLKLLSKDLTVEELKARLLRNNILIRDCSNFKGLGNGFIRIAIKSREANQQLLEALKRLD